MQLTKNDSLALKGVAILMMYVHHFYLAPERWAGHTVDFFPLTEGMTVYIAQFFKICVAFFVFVTGYGMTMSMKKKDAQLKVSSSDLASYTYRRLVSLLCNFIFVFLLVILVSLPSGRWLDVYGKSGSSLVYFFMDMFGLANAFKTPTYNGTWWYMSVAIALVVLFPFLVKLYRDYRWTLLAATLLLPRLLKSKVEGNVLPHWMFAMLLGMYCAESGFFQRWKECEDTHFKKIPSFFRFLFYLLLLIVCIVVRQSAAGQELLDIFDGIIPLYVILFCLRYILPLPGIRQILMFLGKHSMNMFLTHTLIRETFFHDFSYGFGNAWLNVLVLLVITIPISMVIEWLKKVLHFSDLVRFIQQR